MKLAVFGASGRTGQAMVRLALSRGWELRALVRPSSRIEDCPGLEIFRGSLDSPRHVALTLSGTSAVCCVFGPRSPQSEPFCARAIRTVVSAMQASDVRRLVCLTGAMVGELPPNVSLGMRALAAMFRRRVPLLATDSAAQERIVMESGLDWTIVKPPRLTDGPAIGRVRAGAALRVGLLSKISRGDLAAALLDEVGSEAHVRQRIYVRK